MGLHNKIFSGFRSQWMIDSSGVARNNNAVDKNKSYMNKPITFISDYILSLISFAKFLIKQSKGQMFYLSPLNVFFDTSFYL